MQMHESKHLYVVGGGFSGTALAYELIIQNKAKKVFIIEKIKANLFRGVAYNCHSNNYILNVKARDLGFRADVPLDFINWLNENYPGQYLEDDFVSRNLYGNYLEERMKPFLDKYIFYIDDEIIDIDLNDELIVGKKEKYPYGKVILALGGGYISPDLPFNLENQKDIYIKGTGLSAIDIVVDLYKKNFKGNIHLCSRHGLLPLAHDHGVGNFTITYRLKDLFMTIKKIYRQQRETQFVLIQLRPKLEELWNGFTQKEKNQFKKYLRPYWEVFRHRTPVEHLQIINELISEKRLNISRKIIEGVTYIDCTGFNKIDKNEFFQNLVRRKVIEKDIFGWGARSLNSKFIILGPLQKYEKFEITAIKELREEIKKLALSL